MGKLKMMRVKKVRRKCNVRGCKSFDCYSISRSSESGNSVIICKDCLADAYKAVEAFEKLEKRGEQEVYKPLFYHPETEVTLSSVTEDIEPTEAIEEDVTEDITISVAEDTVTTEEPIIADAKPDVVLPSEATQTSNAKKKTNKGTKR